MYSVGLTLKRENIGDLSCLLDLKLLPTLTMNWSSLKLVHRFMLILMMIMLGL